MDGLSEFNKNIKNWHHLLTYPDTILSLQQCFDGFLENKMDYTPITKQIFEKINDEVMNYKEFLVWTRRHTEGLKKLYSKPK